jgi:hypothetical protein
MLDHGASFQLGSSRRNQKKQKKNGLKKHGFGKIDGQEGYEKMMTTVR